MIPRYNIKRIKSKLQGNVGWSDYIPPRLDMNPNNFDDGTIDRMYDELIKSSRPQFMSLYVNQPYDGDAQYFFQLRGYDDLTEVKDLEKRINKFLFDLTGVFSNDWNDYTVYSDGVIELNQPDYLSVNQLSKLLGVLAENTALNEQSDIDLFYHGDFVEYNDASKEWLLEGMAFQERDILALIAPKVDHQATDTIISLPVEGDMMKLTRLPDKVGAVYPTVQIEYTSISNVSDVLMKRVLQEYPAVTLFVTAYDNDSFQFFKKYGFKLSDWSEVGTVVEGIKLVRNPNDS